MKLVEQFVIETIEQEFSSSRGVAPAPERPKAKTQRDSLWVRLWEGFKLSQRPETPQAGRV